MADGNPGIAMPGHNGPPAFETLRVSLEDHLDEARNWADGTPAETQEQVDEIARLIDELNQGAKAMDAERVREKKPLDDQIAAIQDRYNVWLAPLKNKVPGKVPMAIEALNAAKRPFLLELERQQAEAARKAREEAEAKALAAAEALRQADAANLSAREEAEAKIREAEEAARAAKAAEGAKAHTHGGGRAQGLRTKRVAVLTDANAAIRFYWQENPQPFLDLVQKLADDDARANRNAASGHGVEFREERV